MVIIIYIKFPLENVTLNDIVFVWVIDCDLLQESRAWCIY